MRVRGFVLITGAIALTGCSTEQRAGNSGTTNINAAAAAAQGDIDTYAANSMEVAAPAATTVPKAAPADAPAERLAAKPAPAASPAAEVLGNRQAALIDASDPPRPCPTQNIANVADQTRVSGRPDDAEFERGGRDAKVQRATVNVWQKGDGQALRTGRDAGEPQVASVGCTTN